jgi:hypothetical protein
VARTFADETVFAGAWWMREGAAKPAKVRDITTVRTKVVFMGKLLIVLDCRDFRASPVGYNIRGIVSISPLD